MTNVHQNTPGPWELYSYRSSAQNQMICVRRSGETVQMSTARDRRPARPDMDDKPDLTITASTAAHEPPHKYAGMKRPHFVCE